MDESRATCKSVFIVKIYRHSIWTEKSSWSVHCSIHIKQLAIHQVRKYISERKKFDSKKCDYLLVLSQKKSEYIFSSNSIVRQESIENKKWLLHDGLYTREKINERVKQLLKEYLFNENRKYELLCLCGLFTLPLYITLQW